MMSYFDCTKAFEECSRRNKVLAYLRETIEELSKRREPFPYKEILSLAEAYEMIMENREVSR